MSERVILDLDAMAETSKAARPTYTELVERERQLRALIHKLRVALGFEHGIKGPSQ